MTRAERVLAHRWRSVLLACVLVALAGAVIIIWTRIDHETSARKEAIAEANLRGDAVSTLSTDVRQLRAQVQALGKTPVAPDPSAAVSNLPARTEVPVPIPGPPGASGIPGPAGQPGPAGSPGPSGAAGSPGATGAPGTSGASGQDGAGGVPGPAGPQGDPGAAGPAGPAGQDGADGKDGQTCPDGYSLQPPPDDQYALVCRQDDAPSPTPSSTSPPAVLSDRRRI